MKWNILFAIIACLVINSCGDGEVTCSVAGEGTGTYGLCLDEISDIFGEDGITANSVEECEEITGKVMDFCEKYELVKN